MSNPAEKGIVEKALTSGVGGCVEWHPKEAQRVRKELAIYRLTPEGILKETIKFVQGGGNVHQVKETRSERSHREYYYKVIMPIPGLFRNGLFVEMELEDPDPDVPTVTLLDAHEQK
jgi:hypothetical protein